MTNERDLDVNDAVPRIGWGKYVPREGRLVLHLSREVNHRFVDRVHIGQFARALERSIEALFSIRISYGPTGEIPRTPQGPAAPP